MLLYNPKKKGTFKSARWQKEYTPDLAFVTKKANQRPIPTTREILNDFPHSQHRPVLITTGITIPRIQALPKPRWNFRKANWEKYSEEIDKTCPRIPPTEENLHRFGRLLKTASKKHIPRGVRKMYIPCWSEESQKLLEEYEKTQNQETAEELLTSLEENRRERWIEVVENMDMTRSSRHAWQTIKKIDPDKYQPRSAPPIGADEVAKEIKQRGQHIPDHSFEKKMRKEYQKTFNSLPKTDSQITSPISAEDMSEAIKSIKNGKAAGIDGIYPDMITHLGPKAKEWLATAMTDVISKSKYPQEWKHARVIAILKPGKPATEPSSYRPISLLCCLYKLLERILLTRITPYVNPHITIEQAGFRP